MMKPWLHRHPMWYALYKENTYRTLTAGIRTLPDFIIIGEQKCGSNPTCWGIQKTIW